MVFFLTAPTKTKSKFEWFVIMPENQILTRAWDPEKKIRDNQPLLRVNQVSIWKRVPKIVMSFFRVTVKNAWLGG